VKSELFRQWQEMRPEMRIFNRSACVILAVAMVILAVSAPRAHAKSKTRTIVGTISAIDLKHDTVVVEAHILGGQRMTVGGPLVDGAKLGKDHQPAVKKR